MKCNQCAGEWSPPPGKSVTSCPFCFEPIQNSSSDTLSGNIITEIVRQYGEGILLESSRLFSIVSDKLQNNDPQMLKRLRLAINVEGLPKKLLALKSLDEHERQLKVNIIANALADDYEMKIESVFETVNYFAESLGYKPMKAPQRAAPPAETAAAEQIGQPSQKTIPGDTPKIGSIIPFGGHDWRVLDVQNSQALILSEKALEERAYHSSGGSVTWEGCELRGYLNGEFYNKFSAQDKARIVETSVTTNNNPWYGTKGGGATKDMVFLLSIEEAVKYFGDSGQLRNRNGRSCWIDDQYNNARIAKDAGGAASWWWLRSPGDIDDLASLAADVDDDGNLYVGGSRVLSSSGVRPALRLNLQPSVQIAPTTVQPTPVTPQPSQKTIPGDTPKIGSIIPFGGHDWRVLDVQNSQALILSEKVLEARAYHFSFVPITWAACELRGYLNGEFYNKFGAQEKARIVETSVTTNNNPWYGSKGGRVTKDKIFLLSIEEAVKYFGDSGQLRNKSRKSDGWIDDQYNNARIAKDAGGAASWWWLRSPGYSGLDAAGVYKEGFFFVSGSGIHGDGGVRPALWLKL